MKMCYGLLILPALILSVFILGVLSMYWAVLSHVNENVSSLTIFVVDFDGMAPYTTVVPQIGPFIVQATEQRLAAPKPHLGYETVSPEHFANDPMNVRQEIFDQKAWAAIIINANATALLQQAVETGNTSYDPLGACQIIWVEARDEDTIHAHVGPELQSLAASLTAQFGARWTKQVLQNNTIPNNNLEAAPQALSPAIGFSIFNLRPFDPPVTVPAVTIGLIYLIIISFFSFAFYMPTHMKFLIPAGHPPLHFNQFIIYRWFATMAAYLSMSLFYSFISLAFKIPFNNPTAPGNEMAHNPNAYGAATFVVYWMINWIGMIALGLACENVAMIIGQPWTAMWLIFWVISNVATSFYALDLTPKFYYWGYAWPLHQSKFISPFFNSKYSDKVLTFLQSSKPRALHSSTSTRASVSISAFSSHGRRSTAFSSLSAATSCGGRRKGKKGRRWRRRSGKKMRRREGRRRGCPEAEGQRRGKCHDNLFGSARGIRS
jgi:hypothetical protein